MEKVIPMQVKAATAESPEKNEAVRIHIQEQERQRFASEIHDGIGPLLAVLKLNIGEVQEQCENAGLSLSTSFQKLFDLVDLITSDIRNISHALLPATLSDFGLDATLRHICSIINATGNVKVEYYANAKIERFEPDIELHLYRIAQELLNNAMKYAQASLVVVQLIRHEKTVVLMVEDDGIGFDRENTGKKLSGIGLQDIQARVKLLQGEFVLESAPGEGVLAAVEIPLPFHPL